MPDRPNRIETILIWRSNVTSDWTWVYFSTGEDQFLLFILPSATTTLKKIKVKLDDNSDHLSMA